MDVIKDVNIYYN